MKWGQHLIGSFLSHLLQCLFDWQFKFFRFVLRLDLSLRDSPYPNFFVNFGPRTQWWRWKRTPRMPLCGWLWLWHLNQSQSKILPIKVSIQIYFIQEHQRYKASWKLNIKHKRRTSVSPRCEEKWNISATDEWKWNPFCIFFLSWGYTCSPLIWHLADTDFKGSGINVHDATLCGDFFVPVYVRRWGTGAFIL